MHLVFKVLPFIFATSVLAASEFKLGVVDFQRALNGVEEGKAKKASLQKEAETRMADEKRKADKLEKIQKDLAELEKKLPAGNPQMASPEILEKGRKMGAELQQGAQEYAELKEKNRKELIEKEQAATQDILEKLNAISQELGRAGGFTMVLERGAGALVYASESTDLTEKVIQTFNSKFKGKSGK